MLQTRVRVFRARVRRTEPQPYPHARVRQIHAERAPHAHQEDRYVGDASVWGNTSLGEVQALKSIC